MMAFIRKPGSAATAFMVGGAAWFAVGTVYGMFSAIHLAAPTFFDNIAGLVFGRTRPAHVNTMIFGFTAMMLMGAALYFVPALLRVRLWSEPLGWLSFVLWNATVLSGEILFPLAITQGREYAEYIWPFDAAFVASLLLILFNLAMTVANRREPILYVSVWYVIGSALAMSAVYPLGNVMWRPPDGALPGLIDSVFLWFYGHNLVGLLLTPLAVGAALYVLPRISRTPLYSHTLALIGFWTLFAIYSHIGGHHILQAPIPNWLKVLSAVDSMAMFIPVFVALANIWLTVRRRLGAVWSDPAGRFVFVGTLWYLLTCIQGPLQSLPSVQKVTHFNNWVVGHAHIAVLGFSGFIALGAMWHVLPLACGRKLYSTRLAAVQLFFVLIGVSGFFVVLSIAGLIQGEAWRQGELVYRVLPMIANYMFMRALFGVFIFVGAFIGLYNAVMTLARGRPLTDDRAGAVHVEGDLP